ncbi:MAG: hypothetical protein J6I68_14265 [Butyrivibrio sp.]|uniref:hypothetical protein n=1 Tax=Butyrivibrio sp. TaxID=28121 RepID=UPI001B64BE74|nr:hypothetical protein [Butyrivibrio sp.]MBP3784406.1 hypothetical protein [Butyrivibrio sp.]
MSRICPETGKKVVYLVCQECDDRLKCLSKSKQELARQTGQKSTVKIKEKQWHKEKTL